MGKERRIRFGLFQLRSHPAVILADDDLLKEPFTDASLAVLAREDLGLRECLDSIKRRYLAWHSERLERLLEWLRVQSDQPNYVAFPECSMPFECLPLLKSYADQTGITFFAGTHTPRTSKEAIAVYKKQLKVISADIKGVLQVEQPAAAVMPIISASDTLLRPKGFPSVFERTEIDSPKKKPLTRKPIIVSPPKLSVLPLICAETLKLASWGDELPELVVILAYDRAPSRFTKHIEMFVENKIPVVFVNDGEFGGSGIFPAIDSRTARWWFGPPNNGRLPVGEAYLELELDLNVTAVEVGVTSHSSPGTLVRLVPIFSGDDSFHRFESEGTAAAEARDQPKLMSIRRSIAESHNAPALLLRRWAFLESLLANDTLSDAWLESVGRHIQLTGIKGIESLEAELATIAIEGLHEVEQNHAPTPDSFEYYGRLVHARKAAEKKAGSRQLSKPSQEMEGEPLPIGRTDIVPEVRTFASKGKEALCVVTGLPAIGKSTVIQASLKQAGVKFLRVQCFSGTSADYIYEQVLNSTGRVPTGSAPRMRFNVEDLVDALSGVKVLWLQDCHNLLEYGAWRTSAIENLVRCFLETQSRSGTRLVFESRRAVTLDTPLGTQILKRRLGGLLPTDAVAFFEQQLQRAGVALDTVSEQDRREIARLVDGHPGMLILCADACTSRMCSEVIADLKARRGFYLDAVRGLLRDMRLSTLERKILDALSKCRLPVPVATLASLKKDGDFIDGAGQLVAAGMVERDRGGLIQLVPLLQSSGMDATLDVEEAIAIHSAAASYFSGVANSGSLVDSYTSAIEANYHAALAGEKMPCDTAGMLDGLAAAANEEYAADRHDQVIRLLEPIAEGNVPEDVLAVLADSYAWEQQFDKAFDVAERVVSRNRSYTWLFTSACQAAIRSRSWDAAHRAVEKAELYEKGSYVVDLYKGRLAEKDNSLDDAIGLFREATRKTERDPWPFFYLARSLIRRGQPEEALDVIRQAQEFLEGRESSRFLRNVERALRSQELLALAQVGEDDRARLILDILEETQDPRPELIVTAAFVRAYFSAKEEHGNPLPSFERALKQLSVKDSRRDYTRAQIALFRGKLFEQLNDLSRAEEEFERATKLDPHNVYVKVRLLRTLQSIARHAKSQGDTNAAKSAATRACEVVRAILRYDPNQRDALYAQEDLFREFGIQ